MNQPAWQRAGPQRNVTRGRCVGVGQAQGTGPMVLAWSRALLGAVGTCREGKIPSSSEKEGSKRDTKPVLPHLPELLEPRMSHTP